MDAEYVATIRREVEQWPGAAVDFSKRAKHNQATIRFEGRTRFVVIPSSPGDSRRGALNSLADVRKELLALGAVKSAQATSTPRKIRRPATPKPSDFLRHIELAPVKPNPFDALAKLVAPPPPPPPPEPIAAPWWKRIISIAARWVRMTHPKHPREGRTRG